VLLEFREGCVAHLITFLGSGERFTEFGLPKDYEFASTQR
jgi:hypothetical protein